MSIAITAPQMFAFQDIACVYIMLRFANIPDAKFFVEPEDGEDGELHFTQNSSNRCVEIQVKGSSKPITLAKVAACLAHTPDHTEKDTLLERMLSDPDRLVMLVMSGRCDNACAPYTVGANWNGTPRPVNAVSKAQAAALLDAFAVTKTRGAKDSPLKAKRRTHNNRLVQEADKGEVKTALSRLIIIECVNKANIEANCAEWLRKHHRVPSDRIGEVLGQLRADVETAKADRTDAFPLIRKTLAAALPPPIRPPNYIKRGVECALFNELSSRSVLLLSGIPRVGKTYTARWIAAEFEPDGYEVRKLINVDEAERLLLEETDAPRLVILDDPLGGTHAVDNPGRVLERIASLIPQLPPHRKLIVTQGEPLLLPTARATSLSTCSTANHPWHDLGTFSAHFLSELWRSFVNIFDVPDTLREFVSEALSNGSLRLEPGCLEHLASGHQRLNDHLNLDRVTRLAREGAADLGRALNEAGHGHLLSALALTTTAQERIDLRELAFVTGAGGNTLPGKQRIDGSADSPEPHYDDIPCLSLDQEKSLDNLERRRVVKVDPDEYLGFTHPFYRAAAEYLVNDQTYFGAARIVSTVKRGLFCFSPLTSQSTARNMDWVFGKLTARNDIQSKLVDHAIDGCLRSHYPATRDLCFHFLIRRLADIPADRGKNPAQWISAVTSFQLYDLEWSNGQAYLPFNRTLSTEDLVNRVFMTVEHNEIETELSLLNAPEGEYVSPEQAAKVLRFFASEPSALTLPAIGRLLSYDEAVLRSEAIKAWLSTSRDNDEATLSRVFDDDHPSCALAALQGAIAGWRKYSMPRREQILDGLSGMAETATCATVMLDHLVRLDWTEDIDASPWLIFETLFPIIMQVLPYNATFIARHLFDAARSAVKALPSASMVAICDGWIGWIERNTTEDRLPCDHSLGVVEILVQATQNEPELRDGRINRLLAFQGTGAMVAFVADLVKHWEKLTDGEQMALLARLKAGLSDDLWLQAAALTRTIVPAMVQRTLLGDGVSLNDGPDALLAEVDPELMNAAVHVYIGRPQPLWWLGTHHRGKAVWEPVVDQIARRPPQPLFELTWEDIALNQDGAQLSSVITSVGRNNADRMLDILIRLTVDWNISLMPKAWAALLALAPNDKIRATWIDKMAFYAPAILNSLFELKLWLAEDRDLREMCDRLNSDILLLREADLIFTPSGDSDVNTMHDIQSPDIQRLHLMLKQTPPRLLKTCDALSNILQRSGIVELKLTAILQQHRERILEDIQHIKDELDRPDMPLPGWIGS